MRRITLLSLLVALGFIVAPASAAAAPTFSIDTTAPAGELVSGQLFTITIGIFSTAPVTDTIGLRQEIDPSRFDLISVSATRGDYQPIILSAQGQPDRTVGVRWSGDVAEGHPALLSVTLQVRQAAPPGQFSVIANAANAAGDVAEAHEAVRLCCLAVAPAQRPGYRRYLGIIRR